MIAWYSGRCPLCGAYIAKGRSRIERICATVPTAEEGLSWDVERGTWRQGNDEGPDLVRPRRTVHKRCFERWHRMVGDREPIEFAREREAGLAQIKADAIARFEAGR